MYSKTRNTLTALIAASLLVAAGWLFGHPVTVSADSQGALPMQAQLAAVSPPAILATTGLHARHANRMSLAMPYYSFSLSLSQRRAD